MIMCGDNGGDNSGDNSGDNGFCNGLLYSSSTCSLRSPIKTCTMNLYLIGTVVTWYINEFEYDCVI